MRAHDYSGGSGRCRRCNLTRFEGVRTGCTEAVEARATAAVQAEQCPAFVVLDFDPISCRLVAGHNGFHRDHGDGGEVLWWPAPTEKSVYPAAHPMMVTPLQADMLTNALDLYSTEYPHPDMTRFIAEVRPALLRIASERV